MVEALVNLAVQIHRLAEIDGLQFRGKHAGQAFFLVAAFEVHVARLHLAAGGEEFPPQPLALGGITGGDQAQGEMHLFLRKHALITAEINFGVVVALLVDLAEEITVGEEKCHGQEREHQNISNRNPARDRICHETASVAGKSLR